MIVQLGILNSTLVFGGRAGRQALVGHVNISGCAVQRQQEHVKVSEVLWYRNTT